MNSPMMRPEEVEQVSVEWLLKHLDSTVEYSLEPGNDYSDLISYKSQDASFEPLVATILEEGFRIPVVVQMWQDGSLSLGNGHHRLAAAILLCLDSMAVFWTQGDYMAEGVSYNTGDDYLNFAGHRGFLSGLLDNLWG